ncbi:pPIWI_RE module domain-containing protein [Streptomyces cremeus]|uniref:PPIWI_RE module domain-containing protein n=1 Tax=Streptomyces cremeus TaxID=66881 RepID=A0ABV5P5B1_STRCM
MYDSVRRSAYHLAPDAAPWSADYRVMPFPEQWSPALLDLCNHGQDDEDKRLWTVPTYRFDSALQTFAPDLVVRPRPRTPVGEVRPADADHWLYAPVTEGSEPLPQPMFRDLVQAWLPTLNRAKGRDEAAYRRLLLDTAARLRADLPGWQGASAGGPLTVDLLGTLPTEGGTAAPSSRQFQLATDAFARRIAALDPYEFEGGLLRFRPVARGPKEQGAELISQPLRRTVKRKEWWFSIRLNITLHTTPFDLRPRLHLHWGVRRWATHLDRATGRLRLAYGQDASVFLLPTVPWLPGAPVSSRYAVARITRPRGTEDWIWRHNDAGGLLGRLSPADHFPASPDTLLTDPESWLTEGRPTQAMVAHSTRSPSAHEIGGGLMPHQRSELSAWAEQALPEGLVRVPDLERRGTGASAPANRRPKSRGTAVERETARAIEAASSTAQRRTALAAASGSGAEPPLFEARLLWRTERLRTAAIEEFTAVLGLGDIQGRDVQGTGMSEAACEQARPNAPVILEWVTPELHVRLRCLPLINGLAEPLTLDPAVKGRGERFARAVTTRRSAVRSWLAADGTSPSEPGLALVEIGHPSLFRPSATDPKFALRLGSADAGALTQFVVSPSPDRPIANEQSLGHRTHSAWLDGLRQLGVRVLPAHTLGDRLPAGLRYAALWMVKRRKDGPTRLPKHVPVAVLVSPCQGTAAGRALVHGWDDELREWVPYPAFLLGLVRQAEIDAEDFPDQAATPGPVLPAQRNGDSPSPSPYIASKAWRQNLQQQRRETANFLQRVLHSLHGEPTVLITHAQNSRAHWPWLQDGQVVPDLLRTGHAPAEGMDPDLRLVRVRGTAGRETAQWWGLAPDPETGKNGQPTGFWAAPHDSADAGDEGAVGQRVFYSATSRPQSHPVSPKLDRLAMRTTASGNQVSQAGKPAWNPNLAEVAVLGCHPLDGDEPEALAMAMHQLRQAPDYADALSLPLPLHLAGLAQAYVLPMRAENNEATAWGERGEPSSTDGCTTEDPDYLESPRTTVEAHPLEQASLF